MPSIRPFETHDVPAVSALRRRVFRHTRATSDLELCDYVREVFFGNPWSDPELPSLVLESDSGTIDGFIGIIPRPMTLGGKRVRAAVATQLMVAPEARGVAGARLLQRAFAGTQELLITDVPTDRIRRLWTAAGGSVAEAYGFYWSHPVRLAPRRLGPLRRGVEALARRTAWHPLPGAAREGAPAMLTAEAIAEALPSLVGSGVLRGDYDASALRWLLRRALSKWGEDRLGGSALRSADGRWMGWFLYVRQDGDTADLLQLVAHAEHYPEVWRQLLHHAYRAGSFLVRGRYEPRLMPTLKDAPRCSFHARAPGLLAYSRDLALLNCVLQGNAMLTGLDGEWWLDF